ncbi:hypothetical protein IKW75_00360 [Candidatus Saccharibacteria bacterium]|nr:hypothetical protein [Candidatus Saccharibacteria bacterium]
MNKIIKSLIVGAFALGTVITSVASPAQVHAEEDASSIPESSSWIQVSPVSARVVLRPGSELDYSIIVSNVGTDSFNFSVYAAPYTIVDEDYNVSFADETNRSQIVRWIKFVNDDGSLVDTYKGSVAAGAKKTVNYRVTVPNDIPAGGQYATIFAQTEPTNTEATTSGLKTVSRIGMVVYGRTEGETDESAEITEYHLPGFLLNGPVKVSSVVKNNGNTDIEARYTYTVKSIVGGDVYNEEAAFNILPDTSRRQEFSWENAQPMGIFNITYKVEVLGEVHEESHLLIILPVYMIVIMIILLTALAIWITILVRKRKERKSRLMV